MGIFEDFVAKFYGEFGKIDHIETKLCPLRYDITSEQPHT